MPKRLELLCELAPQARVIALNAMGETVATKPAFRDAFARGQRCIVPVDAFDEWKKTSAGKQPYAVVGADGLPLAMAGLWERWKDRATGDTLQTFTMIVCPSCYHANDGPPGWASARPIRTNCDGWCYGRTPPR